MTLQQQTNHIDIFMAQQTSVLLSKGNDYSDEDRLSTFKEVGRISQLSPEEVCLVFLGTKLTRLTNLLKNNKEPNNESINDSILDMANYCILLSQILEDKKN
jgi:hypothetical protein